MISNELFLAVVGLPEPVQVWWQKLDMILGGIAAVVMVTILIVSAVNMIRSRQRNQYCPNCRTKTVISSRTEKENISGKFRRIGNRRKFIVAGNEVRAIPVCRCKNGPT